MQSRKTICFKNSSYDPLYSMIYNNKLKGYINSLCGKHIVKPSFPIEYKIYPKGSKWIGIAIHHFIMVIIMKLY